MSKRYKYIVETPFEYKSFRNAKSAFKYAAEMARYYSLVTYVKRYPEYFNQKYYFVYASNYKRMLGSDTFTYIE